MAAWSWKIFKKIFLIYKFAGFLKPVLGAALHPHF